MIFPFTDRKREGERENTPALFDLFRQCVVEWFIRLRSDAVSQFLIKSDITLKYNSIYKIPVYNGYVFHVWYTNG